MAWKGLLCVYFLHSFYLTFPLTAYGSWLFDTIHMSPSTTSLYYALAFLPWNLKPIYGLISDSFPVYGYHRKPYLVCCDFLSAVSIFITGKYVTTVTGAFLMKMVDSSCEAFSQIMLGVFLVDIAKGDTKISAQIQSLANAVKNGASIVALLIGLPVYKSATHYDARTIIQWTSLIPLVSCAICLFILTEKKLLSSSSLSSRMGVRGCCQKFKRQWHIFLKKLILLLPCWPLMLFLCLCSAFPKDGSIWYQYTYSLFKDNLECLQYTSLASMCGRLLSCIIYGRYCTTNNFRVVFIVATICSAIAGLPRLLLAPPIAKLPIGLCTFATIESTITSFASEFALLPLLVIATSFCPRDSSCDKNGFSRSGLAYSVFLSFMDLGGVISGFITSSLVVALGIVMNPKSQEVDWTNVWVLVILSACSQIAILFFIPLIPNKQALSENDDENKSLIGFVGDEPI